MNPDIYRQSLKFGGWSGILFCVLFGIGWAGIAGWFPPPAPSLSVTDVAQMYLEKTMRIRVGCLFMMLGSLFFIPFTGALTTLIAKIEGRFGVWSVTALCGGALTTLFIFYPTMWWLTNAFRPDRDPNLIYMFNDWAWLQFVGAVFPALGIWMALSVVSFAEKDEDRLFARWYGYFNFWIMVSFFPSQLLFFVKTGPFAWNGLFAIYLPATTFFGWFIPTLRFIWKNADKPA
jgi:hypothetical protein